ncbi:MAG: polysaccharide biosynthesis tyrosine autokinase, partial [Puniceicoccales bacterium]
DRLAIQYKVREKEVDSKRRTYERLIDRLNETIVTSQLDSSMLRVMDEASVPGSPVSPSKKKTILAAGFVFVLCFIGIPLGLELIDNRIRTYADIDRVLKKPLLGDVREIQEDITTETKAMGVLGNQEEITEAFRNIYSNLHLKEQIPNTFTLMISSTIPSEGKTFTAINLASIYARHGHKTLLLDADLRRPSLAKNLGVSNEKGLLAWLRSRKISVPHDGDILSSPELGLTTIAENLDLIPAGGSTKSPTEALSSEHLDILISHLKEKYDFILFDTPPVGVFPDATILADFTDAAIYVVRQKKVPRAAARHGVNLLDQSRSPVWGIVLNGVTTNPSAGPGHYGDYGYGQQGGYGYRYAYGKKYREHYQTNSSE